MRDESRAQKIRLFPNDDTTPQQVLLEQDADAAICEDA